MNSYLSLQLPLSDCHYYEEISICFFFTEEFITHTRLENKMYCCCFHRDYFLVFHMKYNQNHFSQSPLYDGIWWYLLMERLIAMTPERFQFFPCSYYIFVLHLFRDHFQHWVLKLVSVVSDGVTGTSSIITFNLWNPFLYMIFRFSCCCHHWCSGWNCQLNCCTVINEWPMIASLTWVIMCLVIASDLYHGKGSVQ